MSALQEDIRSSRELITDSELDQLLFDVVLGFHRGGAGTSEFSLVRDAYAFIRDKIGAISESDVLACHSVLHGTSVRSFRGSNVLVGGGGGVRSASYVPPDYGSVPLLMRDWRKYINGICADPIAGIVVGVFRLLQIHPFHDGNGRTARLMLLALMSKYYGARSGVYDVARRMFASGNHELLLSSLRQIRENDWNEAFKILK